MKTKKTNKTTKNAKPAKKPAVKCVLCGAEIKGHGNNPAPLANEGVCCDECNAKVLNARVEEAKSAKRNEYAREYYKRNREKLVEASRRSHAKRNREAKELMNEACDILLGIASEHEFEWLAKYGDPSVVNRLAAFLKKEVC